MIIILYDVENMQKIVLLCKMYLKYLISGCDVRIVRFFLIKCMLSHINMFLFP